MIYKLFRSVLTKLLRVPDGPPPAPLDSPPDMLAFRALPAFRAHQLFVWGGGFAAAIVGEVILLGLGQFERIQFGPVDIGFDADWFTFMPVKLAIVLTVIAAIGKHLLIHIDYELRYYIVTDRNIRIRQGDLSVYEATFAFANIQNMKINQGPLERLFGISTLTVQTAGGAKTDEDENPFGAKSGHEGVVRGIKDAEELRAHIQRLLDRYRDSGLGDLDDVGTHRVQTGVSPAATALLKDVRDELRGVHAALRA